MGTVVCLHVLIYFPLQVELVILPRSIINESPPEQQNQQPPPPPPPPQNQDSGDEQNEEEDEEVLFNFDILFAQYFKINIIF